MSQKSMFKKFLKGSAAKPKASPPRSKDEIQQAYTRLAQVLGDKHVKVEGIKREIEELYKVIDGLGAELNERMKLDEAQAKENSEEKATEEATEAASAS